MLLPVLLISSLLYVVNGAPANGKCPEISLPVLSELCEFGPSKNDSNGCPVAPDIICKQAVVKEKPNIVFQEGASSGQPISQSVTEPTRTSPTGPTASTVAQQQSSSSHTQPTSAGQSQTSPTTQGQSSSAAPQPQPITSSSPPPSPHISANESKAVAPPQPVIVSPQLAPSRAENVADIFRQISGSFNETTEEPARNFTFEDMLGTDFLHIMNISQMPEAEEFRKSKGAPENASGKFHRCKVPSDCYNFREPAEWCKPKKNVQWKGRSCFCATDTMTPACIVERTDGEKTQWTFCSSFQDLKCI